MLVRRSEYNTLSMDAGPEEDEDEDDLEDEHMRHREMIELTPDPGFKATQDMPYNAKKRNHALEACGEEHAWCIEQPGLTEIVLKDSSGKKVQEKDRNSWMLFAVEDTAEVRVLTSKYRQCPHKYRQALSS